MNIQGFSQGSSNPQYQNIKHSTHSVSESEVELIGVSCHFVFYLPSSSKNDLFVLRLCPPNCIAKDFLSTFPTRFNPHIRVSTPEIFPIDISISLLLHSPCQTRHHLHLPPPRRKKAIARSPHFQAVSGFLFAQRQAGQRGWISLVLS